MGRELNIRHGSKDLLKRRSTDYWQHAQPYEVLVGGGDDFFQRRLSTEIALF